jgi:hypothetical protein
LKISGINKRLCITIDALVYFADVMFIEEKNVENSGGF